MRRVTTNAADVIVGVRRPQEVGVFVTVTVAAKASLVGLCHPQISEDNYFAFVAAAFDVCCSRSMACFAFRTFAAGVGLKHHLVMRGALGNLVDLFVTALAGLRSHILGLVSAGNCVTAGCSLVWIGGLTPAQRHAHDEQER